MFDVMSIELFGMPFDVLEACLDDETIIEGCRKAINEAITNRMNQPDYPAHHALQDHCSWEDEPSPLDLDEDGDGADVDLLARVGLLGTLNTEEVLDLEDLPF